MPDSYGCQVLAAGYSYHTKPFRIHLQDGMNHYLIRLQTEGMCQLLIDGEMKKITPGHLTLFQPHDPYTLLVDHTFSTDQTCKLESGDYYLFVVGPFIKKWWERVKPGKLYKVTLEEDMVTMIKLVTKEQLRSGQLASSMQDYLTRTLLHAIELLMQEQDARSNQTFVANQMKRYIEEHISTPFQIKDIAAHIGLSPSRTGHLFKEMFHTSIIKYTLELRLSIASEKIRYTPMPLEQVAESCGFQHYTYFYQMFKRKFQMSPSEFRQGSQYKIP
ncbi:AraC family transcriptional regulator [Marinicrinis sediminis]|uniref:AraC family transcriptional regulator n=1 Tax=Marinicrinis sediminis TaxID=1652465 RepID=A0ABW5RE53_9BACL